MSLKEISQIIAGFIVSIGGAGAIIWKLSSYLGNVWAKKHLENIKKEYQKEIETYKNQLEMIRVTTLRYSGQQFELYHKLWQSLYNLKLTADMLWEEANEQNLKKFSQQLRKTTDEVEKSYLFVEESHYNELSNLLSEFNNYKIGKKKLVQLYARRGFRHLVDNTEIRQLVNNNREKRNEYERLIKILRSDLKKQLRGSNN